jgi:hypothetical protein
MSDLAAAFHAAMLEGFQDLARLGYRATYFLQMVQEHGGVETARRLIRQQPVAEGLTKLWKMGRLDLSVEAFVLRPEYAPLFTDEERAMARQRLTELNYTAPWDGAANAQPAMTATAPAPTMVERLTRAVSNTEGGQVPLDEEARPTPPETNDRVDSLAVWQRTIESQSPFDLRLTELIEWGAAVRTQNTLNRRLVETYPAWLLRQFGERTKLLPGSGQTLFINLDGRFVQRVRINDMKGAEIWFPALTDAQVQHLRVMLSDPSTLNQKASHHSYPRNWRFNVANERDLQLVQAIMIDLGDAGNHTQTSRRERGSESAGMTIAEAAFVVLSRAGGGPLHLSDILSQMQAEELVDLRGQTPQLSLASTMLRDDRFQNLGKNSWVLAMTEDEREDAEEVSVPDEAAEPATRPPAIYAEEDARFWRIHFPRELWPMAHRLGVIGVGWPLDVTNQSVKRFHQIATGDRVVAYVQGGQIGGIGVVTGAFDPNQPRASVPTEVTGEEFTQCIRVAWADAPADIVPLLDALRHSQYTALYNRIKNPHTVIPLSRDDYTALLSLLQVDDAGPSPSETRLPNVWTQLKPYIDLARALGVAGADTAALIETARVIDPPPVEPLDADDLVAELLQLRLIEAVDANRYRARPYLNGDDVALLRLCALALLVTREGAIDQYILPARTIIPRLRAAGDAQPVGRFAAPDLGEADSVTLAGWYAEAGLIDIADDTWHPIAGVLEPLPGNDPASQMYNLFVRTALADLDGTLITDLAHVAADAPLPSVEGLEDRLRELGQDLLIDSAIVRRIYRSLLAGRHVVLSGPPGTGKTELARWLPSLLWREAAHTFNRLTNSLDEPPVTQIIEQRSGYASIVVTATEDWGVRDVVGGIAPKLDGQGGGLSYTIEHGALTRTVLLHYDGTESGRKLPPATGPIARRDYRPTARERYRGAWLVIDEFTRAPIDAAFGSLLTTLSGGQRATVAVPTRDGELREVSLPRDFRIIGTLNSFDRHFLNQMSEAMKRRFDFIDVLPPSPVYANDEQGIAAKEALRRMRDDGAMQIEVLGDPPTYHWPGVLRAEPVTDDNGIRRYRWEPESDAAEAAMRSCWRIFSAIRVFRQLGTAQVVAVYLNLLTGVRVAMGWDEALDTALADALADQLHVLSREEQRTIDALIEHAGQATEFADAVRAIVHELPPGRRSGYLYALREWDVAVNSQSDITLREDALLSDTQIARVFQVAQPLAMPRMGVFRRRLRDLIGERGL